MLKKTLKKANGVYTRCVFFLTVHFQKAFLKQNFRFLSKKGIFGTKFVISVKKGTVSKKGIFNQFLASIVSLVPRISTANDAGVDSINPTITAVICVLFFSVKSFGNFTDIFCKFFKKPLNFFFWKQPLQLQITPKLRLQSFHFFFEFSKFLLFVKSIAGRYRHRIDLIFKLIQIFQLFFGKKVFSKIKKKNSKVF